MHPKILIIDDDLHVRAIVSDQLADLGCDVLEATGGEEGLAMAELHRPAVIILDVCMPGMDGFQTFRRLATMPGFGRSQVILLTALGEITGTEFSDSDLVFQLGEPLPVVLQKPASPMVLRQHVSRLLDRPREVSGRDAR